MRFTPHWIVIDLLGMQLGPDKADVMVISVDDVPCQKSLRRAMKAGLVDLDREAATQITTYVRGLDPAVPDVHVELNGRHIAHHVLTHPDHGPLSVALWMHPDPPTERPIVNTWHLDLAHLTTATAGDDVSVIGDGRHEGEERPIQDLWRFIHPTDAAALVIRYGEAIRGVHGEWMPFEWTLDLPETDPVHIFSAGRLLVDAATGERSIVGTSVILSERTKAAPDLLGPLVLFAGVTLAIVNRDGHAAVTSIGADAPLSNDALLHLVTKHDLYCPTPFPITLDGTDYDALVVPISAVQTDAVTVMLRRREGTQ